MNCTRVLHILSPHPLGPSPIMPVDMAMRICMASSPPLRSFLKNYDNLCSSSAAALLPRCGPLRPCLSSSCCGDDFSNSAAMAATTSTSVSAEIGAGSVWLGRKKKSVVFADSQGRALTTVHVFSEAVDDPLTELQFHLTEIEGVTAGLHLGHNKDAADCGSGLVLDFTQPAADYLDLRNRLKAQQYQRSSSPPTEWSSAFSTRLRTTSTGTTTTGTITGWWWQTQMAAHLGALRVLLGWRSRETVVERGGNLIRLEVPGRQQGSSLSGRAGVVWKPPHPTVTDMLSDLCEQGWTPTGQRPKLPQPGCGLIQPCL